MLKASLTKTSSFKVVLLLCFLFIFFLLLFLLSVCFACANYFVFCSKLVWDLGGQTSIRLGFSFLFFLIFFFGRSSWFWLNNIVVCVACVCLTWLCRLDRTGGATMPTPMRSSMLLTAAIASDWGFPKRSLCRWWMYVFFKQFFFCLLLLLFEQANYEKCFPSQSLLTCLFFFFFFLGSTVPTGRRAEGCCLDGVC